MSSYHSNHRVDRNRGTRIYIGNLPRDVSNRELEKLFEKYGKILSVDMKGDFAFIEYDDPRDAKDAIDGRNRYSMDGNKIRVEFSKGSRFDRRRSGETRSSSSYSRPEKGRRSQYQVFVSGLPLSGSWQDLKDHMRSAGEVGYADVYKDGTGIVEYLNSNDMKYAIEKLDETKFTSHEHDVSYITVRNPREASSNSKASRCSRSRSRSRSPRYDRQSRYKLKSRSRSRSMSSGDGRNRKHSRSRSQDSTPPRKRNN